MANQRKSKLIDKINPTIDELKNSLTEFPVFDLKLLYSLLLVDSNLFSFICGIIVNLPISLLFFIVELTLCFSLAGYFYLISFIIAFVCAILMSIYIIKFTLIHIEINKQFNIDNNEIRTNKIIEHCIEQKTIKKLKSVIIKFIIFAIIFAVALVALFLISNFWLSLN